MSASPNSWISARSAVDEHLLPLMSYLKQFGYEVLRAHENSQEYTYVVELSSPIRKREVTVSVVTTLGSEKLLNAITLAIIRLPCASIADYISVPRLLKRLNPGLQNEAFTVSNDHDDHSGLSGVVSMLVALLDKDLKSIVDGSQWVEDAFPDW